MEASPNIYTAPLAEARVPDYHVLVLVLDIPVVPNAGADIIFEMAKPVLEISSGLHA